MASVQNFLKLAGITCTYRSNRSRSFLFERGEDADGGGFGFFEVAQSDYTGSVFSFVATFGGHHARERSDDLFAGSGSRRGTLGQEPAVAVSV